MGSKRYLVLIFVAAFAVTFWLLVKQASTPSVPTRSASDALLPDAPPAQKDDMIVVDVPLPGAQVSSPMIIKGKARGSWFFEGSFPVVLTDWDGKIIAQGHATAQGAWMTTEYVPFTASLTYTIPSSTPYSTGYLILKKDNPSGDPKFDDSLQVKVNL